MYVQKNVWKYAEADNYIPYRTDKVRTYITLYIIYINFPGSRLTARFSSKT